MKFEVTNL